MFRNLTTRYLACALLSLAGLVFLGCGADSSTDETESSSTSSTKSGKSFADLMASVESQRATIEKAFASDDRDAAHGPLHSIGSDIQKLAAAAESEELSAEDIEAVKAASSGLMKSFGNIDKLMHGKEGSTYEDEKSAIEEHMAVLNDLLNSETEGDSTS